MNTKSYKLLITFAITGLALALAVAVILLTQGDEKNGYFPKPTLVANEAASDFTLALIKGGDFHLNDHKGKPIMINFLASWCLPCGEEIPALEKWPRNMGQKAWYFLGSLLTIPRKK